MSDPQERERGMFSKDDSGEGLFTRKVSIFLCFVLLCFAPGVKKSENTVKPLQRNYNIQTRSNVSMENLNFGNPSYLIT